jgi:hypothetical protein
MHEYEPTIMVLILLPPQPTTTTAAHLDTLQNMTLLRDGKQILDLLNRTLNLYKKF